MQAIKTFAEVEHELENYPVTLVYASPDEVIYEVETSFVETIIKLLEQFSPKKLPVVRGNCSFVSVAL